MKLKYVLILLYFICNLEITKGQKKILFKINNAKSVDSIILTKKIGDSFILLDKIEIKEGFNEIVKKYPEKETIFVKLGTKNRREYFNFFLDGKIIIKGDIDSLNKSEVLGSPNTNDWNYYQKTIIEKNRQKLISISQKMRNLQKPIDSTIFKTLLLDQRFITKEIDDKTLDLIKSKPNSYVSLFLLDYEFDTYNPDLSDSLFKSLGINIQKSLLGKTLKEKITTGLLFNEGKRIPSFNVIDLQAKKLNSDQLYNKLTLLDFWGTWCGPCIASLPQIKEIFNSYNNKELQILSIANEINIDPKVFEVAISEQNLKWENFVFNLNEKSKKGNLATLLNITNYPTYILVGKDGVILKRVYGASGINEIKGYLEKQFSRLLVK